MITTAFKKGRKFPTDNTTAKGITNKVMEFIALDDQANTQPSRCHFANFCLPEIYKVVATYFHELLARVSMFSLTAQWIDKDLKLKKAVLHSKENILIF